MHIKVRDDLLKFIVLLYHYLVGAWRNIFAFVMSKILALLYEFAENDLDVSVLDDDNICNDSVRNRL